MKKLYRSLLTIAISAPLLSGCDFFSQSDFPVETKKIETLSLRDYTKVVLQNQNYEYDGKVFVIYADETEKEVTSYCTFGAVDTTTLGEKSFKVSYETTSKIYSKLGKVTVVDSISLESIEITDYTSTVKVNETYTFDGKVTATYNDGTTVDITNKAVISTIDTSSVGEKILVVSFTDGSVTKSTQTAITVTRELTGISISGYKNAFEKDQTFSFTGKVYAEYSDNSKEDVTNSAIIDSSAVDMSTLGEYDLKATYTKDGQTFEATVKISVTAHIPVLQSIAASNYSTTVDKGETYVFNGKVMAHFDVGDDVDVTATCVFGTISTSSSGTKSLSISYTDPNNSSIKKTISVNITVISHVTGVSVDVASLNVAVGKSNTFTPTVSPNDASNKGVTVTSSNSNIAKVGSSTATSGKTVTVTGVAVGTATITVASVDDPTKTASVTVNVSEVANDEWTILMYVCGADLESASGSDGGQATADLQEIASVNGQPDDVNVVVQAGGAKSWKNYTSVINKDYANRFHLKNKTYVKDEQITKANMGLASTLESFLTWGIETYPAENYGLIFWNHGGAMTGCCFDEQYSDDPITPAEASQAIKAAKAATGLTDKFEFIGYDCCLMQVQDIAGLNSEYAKYQVASEESEWGYGWTYDGWIDDLFAKKSTTTILKAIVDSFKSETTSVYGSGSNNDQTLSYLDLSKWSAYETAWENMASTLSGVVNSSSKWNTLASLLNSCQRYGATEIDYWGTIGYPFDVFDVGSFCTKMKASSTYKSNTTLMNNIASVESAYSELVAYEWHGGGSSGSTGLTLFAPVSGYSATSDYSASQTTLSNWRNICINYGSWN